jgi:cGMP-dependent protein kinase
VFFIKGYIKLIDFGTAKKIVDRTSTIIGTPHYMAPEVILGEGYTFSIDFWSIAICLYEFFCGNLPFGDDAEDPMDVYVAIVKSDLNFPKFIKDKEFIHLMKLMLNKNIVARLYKLPLIKKHIWFTKFDWDKLENLNIQIPFHAKKKNYGMDESSVSFTEYLRV